MGTTRSDQEDMFGGPSLDDVTLTQQVECIEREIRMRERVYPRWVMGGKMTQEAADRELLTMRAVHRTVSTLQQRLIAAFDRCARDDAGERMEFPSFDVRASALWNETRRR